MIRMVFPIASLKNVSNSQVVTMSDGSEILFVNNYAHYLLSEKEFKELKLNGKIPVIHIIEHGVEKRENPETRKEMAGMAVETEQKQPKGWDFENRIGSLEDKLKSLIIATDEALKRNQKQIDSVSRHLDNFAKEVRDRLVGLGELIGMNTKEFKDRIIPLEDSVNKISEFHASLRSSILS